MFYGIKYVSSSNQNEMMKMDNCFSDYYGLLFCCPMGKEKEECMFRDIRQLPVKKSLRYIDLLDENNKKTLIENHHRCLKIREKKTLFHESQ